MTETTSKVGLEVGGEMAIAGQIDAPSFADAVAQGEVTNKGGYHQPGPSGPRDTTPDCGCSLTTSKGAYRDVTVELPDGRTVHYYHQSPVVVEVDGTYRLSHCGWDTSTTKQRINRYTPAGYQVYQEDYDWYLSTPDGDREFTNPTYLNS